MKWLVWGWRVVDGEGKRRKLGELECGSGAATALILARKRYGLSIVDHVQSRLSYEIDIQEAQDKLVFTRHHPRRSSRA